MDRAAIGHAQEIVEHRLFQFALDLDGPLELVLAGFFYVSDRDGDRSDRVGLALGIKLIVSVVHSAESSRSCGLGRLGSPPAEVSRSAAQWAVPLSSAQALEPRRLSSLRESSWGVLVQCGEGRDWTRWRGRPVIPAIWDMSILYIESERTGGTARGSIGGACATYAVFFGFSSSCQKACQGGRTGLLLPPRNTKRSGKASSDAGCGLAGWWVVLRSATDRSEKMLRTC